MVRHRRHAYAEHDMILRLCGGRPQGHDGY